MKIELGELVAPGHTAVVTQECQGAIVGPDAGLAALADEARREALPNIARLLPVTRAAGVSVVHCVVQRRPDGLGSNHNARIFAFGAAGVGISPGSPGTELVPELDSQPSDLVLHRWHGIGPMGGTDLDSILRNLGVSTVVAVRRRDRRQHPVAARAGHQHRQAHQNLGAPLMGIQLLPNCLPVAGGRLESFA